VISFSILRAVDAPEKQTAKAQNLGLTWCEFDDEILVWGPADRARQLPDELRRIAGPPADARGDLYLVAQVGNVFLREFPWARVAVNKGRYLAVDLTADELERVRMHNAACFGLRPLPEKDSVFRTLSPAPRRTEPILASLVSQVSQARLAASLTTLAGYRTRHSLTTEFSTAADWAKSRLESWGFVCAKLPISVGTGSSFNVVADISGTAASRRLVLVTAHLDSINTDGGVSAAAPGADDNGSGVAGVLEIAQILSSHSFDHDIRLVLFGGEEQGLHGSQQYVASLPQTERNRLDAIINMDMIATRNTPTLAVLLEGANVSQALMNDVAAAAGDFTSLTVQTSLHPFASDHVPFINAGLPALLTIEGSDSANHNVHTANDTLDKIHYPLAVEILKMNLAVTARRLGLAAGAPRCGRAAVELWAGGGVGSGPLGRVRAGHRPGAVPQVVERLVLGPIAHRLRAHGWGDLVVLMLLGRLVNNRCAFPPSRLTAVGDRLALALCCAYF